MDKEKEGSTEEQEEALHLLNFSPRTPVQMLLREAAAPPCRANQAYQPQETTDLVSSRHPVAPSDGLPNSLRELVSTIVWPSNLCPKDGLPSSLRELHLRGEAISEELKRQCHKLRGTIPIIRVYEKGNRHLLVPIHKFALIFLICLALE
jgi:hypothetical protein